MKTLVESLPEENYEALRFLITFLAQVQNLTSQPTGTDPNPLTQWSESSSDHSVGHLVTGPRKE